MINYKNFIAMGVSATLALGCSKPQDATEVKFDSAHSIALDGTIANGVIVTENTDQASVEREIREQLQYTIGQLNGHNGVADMNKLQVSVGEVVPRKDGSGKADAQYAAKLLVAWPKEVEIPASLPLYLPVAGDWLSLREFFTKFGDSCAGYSSHEVSVGVFWYYYRPLAYSCSIADGDSQVFVANIDLAVSAENTTTKAPEYEKIWEDGKLEVMAIFGKAEAGATSESDAGVRSYNQTYEELIEEYGAPTRQSPELPAGSSPGLANPDIELTFTTEKGDLLVSLSLVEGIRMVDQEFIDKYNKRTETADLVTYSGHSGLGANIQALAQMGNFLPEKYQVFLVNGCDTFAYVDNAITDAHADANPGKEGIKYVDIITNAMPSYFHMNSRSNLTLINAFAKAEETYVQILGNFDQNQRAVVTGEQDNEWPSAFYQ